MRKKYEDVSKDILNGLNSYQEYFSREYYLDFEDRISNMKKKIQDSEKEGRLLKIGIVGEVKAGKSSFLNALIFDGKDILPKASTPMTAALTKISYAEAPSATIVFYSYKDWERVEKFSQEYDEKFNAFYQKYMDSYYKDCAINGPYGGIEPAPPKSKEDMRSHFKCADKLKACKELTEMFNRSSVDLNEYLGQTIELELNDIDTGLDNYIGSNGQFTSIVKHVELRMNNEVLREAEIVDTPGLNDPIISRGETTKQFLSECDVVFLLSYCGQFLTQNDITFMCDTLPNDGIRNIVIVGSKLDSGILDDNKSTGIKAALNSSIRIYNRQAEENISKCLSTQYNKETLMRIKDSLPPSYISAMLFSCAMKKQEGKHYSPQEAHIIQRLKRQFDDFDDSDRSLKTLSGIYKIKKEKIIPIMTSKQDIIAEKNKEILNVNKRALLKLLEDITIQVTQNKSELEHYNKNQLENKYQMLQTQLNSMRVEIRNIFENSSVDAAKCLNKMKVEIDKEINNHMDFDIQSESRTEHGSYNEGFLGLRKVHYTETITTYKASVSDIISNIRNYIIRCKKYANDEFEKIINIRDLERSVKDTVIGAFDLSQKNFNENDILIPLEIVIKRIQIPKIDIEVSEYESMIIDAFSGAHVEGEQIHQLKLTENRVLEKISAKIKEEMDKCRDSIEQIMIDQSATFVDNIIKQLNANIDMLKKQIDDKEYAISQYTKFYDALVGYKQIISEMEM